MLIHAIAHRGCTDIVRESALTADSVRKITCCSEGSNPRQNCAWLSDPTLYQQSYNILSCSFSSYPSIANCHGSEWHHFITHVSFQSCSLRQPPSGCCWVSQSLPEVFKGGLNRRSITGKGMNRKDEIFFSLSIHTAFFRSISHPFCSKLIFLSLENTTICPSAVTP